MEKLFAHELSHYSTVIVGNGETPQGEIPMLFLQRAQFIVCCDGALDKLLHQFVRLFVTIKYFVYLIYHSEKGILSLNTILHNPN